MKPNPHIAVLDDEAGLAQLLVSYRGSRGYRVRQLHDCGTLRAPAAPATPRSKLSFAGRELDTAACFLTSLREPDVALSTDEFDLLCAFAQHPGRVLSRDFLPEHTRGREAEPFNRTIDMQVGRLRKKIKADAEDRQIIKSVRGCGIHPRPPGHQFLT